MKSSQKAMSRPSKVASCGSIALFAAAVVVLSVVMAPKEADAAPTRSPTRSTTIALTPDEKFVVVVNREANSVSIIKVKNNNGKDVSTKIDEIPVGEEPRCVAIHPKGNAAYVTNAISGTVSVINLNQNRLVREVMNVGTEPRGCALTADGSFLYVANHTEGTVSIIDTSHPLRPVLSPKKVQVGGRPWAIAITDTGKISDDTVFVTDAFAELIPNGPGEARDLGKQGVVHSFPAGNGNPPITKIALAPLANSGFIANRTSPNNFCNTVPPAQSKIFCPRPDLPVTDPANTMNPQGVFPNQLTSALIRNKRLYLPNIGSQPEPPEVFNVNVQALVYNVDVDARAEVPAEHVNLNQQIAVETAAPPPSLDRTFGNDLVAIDSNADGDKFVIVSRGGNQVIRAKLDASGKLNILNGAGTKVKCRIQTGNLPSGVAMDRDGTRAYTNNEANFSVTSMNVENGVCLTLQLDIDSSTPPEPGEINHTILVGKIAFFTALGIPDNGFQDTPVRNIIPRDFKGKASKDAWSSCGSCHLDGLTDGVTWIFGTGPRQTKPLDGMFSKLTNMDDQGLLNWSAIRGSNTDFNNNSRGVQGGCGFASVVATGGIDPPAQCNSTDPATPPNMTPANLAIYDHGIAQGGSEALDAQTLWIFAAVRGLHQPQPGNTSAGETVFANNCASCHGGAKWTKSQIFHRDDPAAVAQNGAALDPGVTRLAPAPPVAGTPANEFFSFTCNNLTIKYLEDVGTFDVTDPLEIRDNAAASTAFGKNGFNVPSLLSINYHAPYLHRGQAQTLAEVFPLHTLPAAGGKTIADQLNVTQQADLLTFLKSIDGTTDLFRSEGDVFRDAVRAQGTCPAP
jgi:YVTN family beta-propeller protein